jgi:putative thiamine transport system permease protein
MSLARFGPPLTVLALAGPVLAGLAGTLLPAFGYLPALGGGELSLQPFRLLFAEPGLIISVALSLTGGLAATAAALFIVMLFFACWAGTPVFDRVRHMVSPLLAVPHAAAAFGLAFLIAPSGLIVRLISPELTGWQVPPDVRIVGDPFGLALIAGLALKEIPFLFLLTLAALPQTQSLQAARVTTSLGYGRAAGFLFAVWPRLYRQIRLGVFAVVAFSTSVVDVAAILGPTTPAPLAVRLVGWMGDPDLAMRFKASAGAVLQLCVTALALLLWMLGEIVAARLMRVLASRGVRLQRDRTVRGLARFKMAAASVTVFAGLAALAVWSVAGLWQFPDALPRAFALDTWRSAGARLGGPMATTLIVAMIATLIAVALVVLCLLREDETGHRAGRAAMGLIYLPLIVPQAAFLFGLQFLFLIAGLQASMTALILAHLVFVLPYVFLSLSDPWRAFDQRYEMISTGLGKSRLQTLWRVRLPLLLRPLLVAAAIGFAVSVGQYLPTLLIGAGRLPTITTEAVALASGGNRRVIGVYAFVQMLLPAIGFAIAILVPALIFRRFRALRA